MSEENQLVIEVLRDFIKNEVEVECARNLYMVPSNLIRDKIKELQAFKFSDIKNKVGTKFIVPRLHKTRVFMVCRKVITGEIMVLNMSTNAVFEVSTGIIRDDMTVEIINDEMCVNFT